MNFNRILLLLLLLSLCWSCHTALLSQEYYGKLIDAEDQRLEKVLVWVELYSQEDPLEKKLIEIFCQMSDKGTYHFKKEIQAQSAHLYFFTERFGTQKQFFSDQDSPTQRKNSTVLFTPLSPYPRNLIETHLALLDRISFCFQKKQESLLTRSSIQLISNFAEGHFYELFTQYKKASCSAECFEISQLYAGWYSENAHIQNFPLIRQKLQNLLLLFPQ
jgi:hypothetical protein